MILERKTQSYDAFLSYSHDDVKVAAAIQRGLHRVGRRMGQLRALRVYRDATDLAANPGFWSKLTEAITASRYLVAITSPHAAGSEWVDKEISAWVSEHGSDNVLIVLAHGTLVWDSDLCRFDPVQSSAAPPSLSNPGIFKQEPLYVDLTALDSADLSDLGPGVFRSRIVDLAAPIHGKSKDELESEDRTELKRFRRYRRIAIGSLIVLFITSVITSIFAVLQRNEAIDQAANARARELAAISLSEDDPDRALALAVEAEYLTEQPVALARAAYAAATQRQRKLPATATGPGWIGHDHNVTGVSWSATGDQLVSIGGDGALIIWNVEQRQLVNKLATTPGDDVEYLSVAWSPDNKLIAASTTEGSVALWDIETSQLLNTLNYNGETVTALKWSADAQWLAIGIASGAVHAWDKSSGTSAELIDASSDTRDVSYKNDLAWAPDSSRVLSSGTDDGVALILDPSDNAAPVEIETELQTIRAVDWSPNGKDVAFAGADSLILIHDATSGEWQLDISLNSDWIDSIAYSPDSEIIATGDRASELRLFYTDTGIEVGERLTSHLGWVNQVAWSPDGNSIATSSTDFTVRLWALATQPDAILSDSDDTYVYALDWSPDSNQLATTGDDGLIIIRDAHTGTELRTIEIGDDLAWNIKWSPDGKLLAADSLRGSVRIWQADTGQLHGNLNSNNATKPPVTTLSWSPSGAHIVTGDEDGRIAVWNTTDMMLEREIADVKSNQPAVNAANWSPDGTLIAVGYNDSTVRIWNADTGELEAKLIGHNAKVLALSWSPDGDMLASASADGSVRIWDMNTKLAIGLLNHPDWKADVLAVAWSPDGKRIASAFMATSAQIWSGITETDACTAALQALGSTAMATLLDEGSNIPRCADPALIVDLPIMPVITRITVGASVE